MAMWLCQAYYANTLIEKFYSLLAVNAVHYVILLRIDEIKIFSF